MAQAGKRTRCAGPCPAQSKRSSASRSARKSPPRGGAPGQPRGPAGARRRPNRRRGEGPRRPRPREPPGRVAATRWTARRPSTRSPELLRRLITWRIQAKAAFGGLDSETRRRLHGATATSKTGRLEPGTRIATRMARRAPRSRSTVRRGRICLQRHVLPEPLQDRPPGDRHELERTQIFRTT